MKLRIDTKNQGYWPYIVDDTESVMGHSIMSEGGNVIAREKAAYIVQCVNAHESLVETLKECFTSMLDSGYAVDSTIIKKIKLALDKGTTS